MGLHKLGRYAYSLVDVATSGQTFHVYMKLKEGYDPNGAYVGITALQIACELPDEEMFIILLKFGADPQKHTASKAGGANYASGETPLMMCKRLKTEAETKGKTDAAAMFGRMIGYVEDADKLEKAADELIPRLAQLEEEERLAGLSLSGQILSYLGLFLLTVALLHAMIAFLPDVAGSWMPMSWVTNICLFSPVPGFMGHSLNEPYPENINPGTYGYCMVHASGKVTPLRSEYVAASKTEL